MGESNNYNGANILFGEWVKLENDKADPHYMVLKIYRDKVMPAEYVELRNKLFSGKSLRLAVTELTFYEREVQCQEKEKGKQLRF